MFPPNAIHVTQTRPPPLLMLRLSPGKPGKKYPLALAHDRARRKRYRKKKAASRQCEQKKNRDPGKIRDPGETADPKELGTIAPHHSEEPASRCVVINELKMVKDPSHRHLSGE